MSRKLEIELETRIARKVVKALLAAGYQVGVWDEEDVLLPIQAHNTAANIMTVLMQSDENTLRTFKAEVQSGAPRSSFVRLIWGNVADVISDYGMSLADVLKPVEDYTDRYA